MEDLVKKLHVLKVHDIEVVIHQLFDAFIKWFNTSV
jgi:hypothetical protein